MDDKFVFIQGDLNTYNFDYKTSCVMCHHSLHHIANLEHVFEGIKMSMLPNSVFCTIDMIGRNGHMRWPEALVLVEKIWGFLPLEKKFHKILRTSFPEYVNRDCSTEGFEGVRAQDILPSCLKSFGFEKFLAYGGISEIFVGRGFGHNFDQGDELDCHFIDFIEFLNELLIDIGYIKPTIMHAVMTNNSVANTKVYKHWTPNFCVRKID